MDEKVMDVVTTDDRVTDERVTDEKATDERATVESIMDRSTMDVRVTEEQTMDDKKTYYVSVQAETIMENQGDAAYEFEIRASDKEVGLLQEMFESIEDTDNMSSIRAHVPYVQYHNDPENDSYDAQLQDIYRKLYELGTSETRKHIESMGILNSPIEQYD